MLFMKGTVHTTMHSFWSSDTSKDTTRDMTKDTSSRDKFLRSLGTSSDKASSNSDTNIMEPSLKDPSQLRQEVLKNIASLERSNLGVASFKAEFLKKNTKKLKQLQDAVEGLAGGVISDAKIKKDMNETYLGIEKEIKDQTNRWTATIQEDAHLIDTAAENIEFYCKAVEKLLEEPK